MIVVFATTILAIVLAYSSGNPRYRKLFELAFFIVTFIACIHYNYGTDYSSYYNSFLTTSGNNHIFELLKDGYYKEPGWVLLNYALPAPYGFFWLVAIMNVIQNYIYYRFIKDNVAPEKRWLPFAIYLMTSNLYILNFSMLRQGFTVALCVLAGMLAAKKKWAAAVGVVLIASTVHLSALVFLPFIFVCFFPLKKGRVYAIAFLAVSMILFLFQSVSTKIFGFIFNKVPSIGSYLNYTGTIKGWGNTLGLGFLLSSVTYVVFFYFILKRFDDFEYTQRYFLLLSCVALCVIPFQMSVTSIAGRIGTYFSAYQMVVVPTVYSKIKNNLIRLCVTAIFIFMLLVGYYRFFFTSDTAIYYSQFHTVFDVLW